MRTQLKLVVILLFLVCINVNSQIVVYTNNNVGVKTTTTPTEALEVNGNAKATYFIGDGSKLTNLASSPWTVGTSLLYYNSGKVGIGVTSPNETLELGGNIRGNQSGGALRINTSSYGYLDLGPKNATYCHLQTDRPIFSFNKVITSDNGDFGSYYTTDLVLKTGVSYYNTTGTTRITIKNSTGYVGIGTTSPAYLLDVNGVMRVVSTTYTSDGRLKENVASISNPLSSIKNLNGVTYNFKSTNTSSLMASASTSLKNDTISLSSTSSSVAEQAIDPTRKHIGFIAQDVQKIFPELVYEDKDGILSIDYISMIPMLVESIKELNSQIESLKADNEKLKKKLGM